MGRYILQILLAGIFLYFVIQAIRCFLAVQHSKARLSLSGAQTEKFTFGDVTYIDEGKGEVILSVHGIFGGYDQAYETVRDLTTDFRVIAPSRFGYLGSSVMGTGQPKEQAAVFVKLLDRLGIDKVYLLGTSAGGTIALRFALDYPERTKGVLLYSSAMPFSKKPNKYVKYAGPPSFLCNNYLMFLLNPFFHPIMGMAPSTIHSMLPISARKVGVVIDSSLTNPDMAKNFTDYPIEQLQAPVLIFHAKDDKLVKFQNVSDVLDRFPIVTFSPFETGGHLMVGHSLEIRQTLLKFISQ